MAWTLIKVTEKGAPQSKQVRILQKQVAEGCSFMIARSQNLVMSERFPRRMEPLNITNYTCYWDNRLCYSDQKTLIPT